MVVNVLVFQVTIRSMVFVELVIQIVPTMEKIVFVIMVSMETLITAINAIILVVNALDLNKMNA